MKVSKPGVFLQNNRSLDVLKKKTVGTEGAFQCIKRKAPNTLSFLKQKKERTLTGGVHPSGSNLHAPARSTEEVRQSLAYQTVVQAWSCSGWSTALVGGGGGRRRAPERWRRTAIRVVVDLVKEAGNRQIDAWFRRGVLGGYWWSLDGGDGVLVAC
jgi:hypothetical protein